MTPPTTPSAPQPPSVSPSAPTDQPAPAAAATASAAPTIGDLLGRLDGLEGRPLAAQVEVLDGVRRGLDQALSRAPEQR